jgi:hypothetical protein
MRILNKSAVTAIAAGLLPFMTWASSDMFLQIKDAKGATRVVQCAAGVCLLNGLPPGKYSVLECDAAGKAVSSKSQWEYAVVSPRDAASGLATGRRMHKPLTLTMELGRSVTPSGTAPPNEIAIDEPGVQVAIGTTPAAVDAAVAKIGKSRSNIQNN